MKRLALAGLAILALAGPALAEGDAAAGEKVFKKCAACHSIGPDAKNKLGPVLTGVVGRQPGTYEGYRYSSAMKSFGEEHEAWTPDLLDQFLAAPRTTVSGTKMTFAGLKDEDDRANVIAYLSSMSEDDSDAPSP